MKYEFLTIFRIIYLFQPDRVAAAPNWTITQIIIRKEKRPKRQGPSRQAPMQPNKTTIMTIIPAITHAIGAEVNAFTVRSLSNSGKCCSTAGVILNKFYFMTCRDSRNP